MEDRFFKKRLLRLYLSLFGSLVSLWLVNIFVEGEAPSGFLRYLIFILCLPVVILFATLLELAAGVPFSEIASRWDRLRGWQRGVLGILIVVFVIAGFAFAIAIFL